MTGPVEQARALALFKDLIDLKAAERAVRLSTLAAIDPAVHAQVVRLLARDAESDARLGVGAGQRVLAADLLASMLANHDATVDDGPMPDHIGPYRVIGILGRGGMGVVYEAEQADPLRRVAIKTMHAHLHAPDTMARFAFEMQALASLTHRSIPRLYEVRHEGGRAWMVMELVRGVPFARYVEQRPLRERLELLLEVLDGVAFAHEAGIGHRDLKSGNILVADGQPRILDFGLAASLARSEDDHGIAGTLATMAPEQLVRGVPIDHRADVYALGVLLHELLTGELPLVPTSLSDAHHEKLSAPPPRVSTRGHDRDFDFMLARALAPQSADRYPTVRAFQADLRAHLALRPISARPNTLAYRLRCALARHKTAVRGVMVTLATVALLVGTLAVESALDEADAQRAHESAAAVRLAQLVERLAELDGRGAHDEADRLFRYFAAMTDNTGTRALHDAWLHEAQRQHARGNDAAAIAAHASAWSCARDDRQRVDALVALGDLLAAGGDRAGVDQVAALLADPPLAAAPRADAFVTRVRDFHRVVRDHGEGAAALRHLASGTPLEVIATTATVLADDVGREHVIVLDQPARELVTFELDRGEVRRAGVTALADDVLIERWHPSPIAGLPSFMIGPTTEHTTRIYQIRFDAMRARLDPVATLPFAGVSKSVGWRLASGTAYVLVGTAGTDRRLASWRSDDPRVLPAPADLVGAPSDIDDLVSADLDGDGRREVLVAAGAWSAFELRVLRETSGADDVTRPALELVARRRIGSVTQMVLLRDGAGPPLIALIKADRYPSPQQLGAATPFGLPPGVHLLRFDGRALIDVAHSPYPVDVPANIGPHATFVGDLDGDGDDDLALAVAPRGVEHLLLYLRDNTHLLTPVLVGHAAPLATAQLDDDPAAELVVRLGDNQGWVLGLGTTPLPTLPSAATTISPRRWIEGLAGLEAPQRAPGHDTPETVVADQGRLHPAWLVERAGTITRVPGTPAAIGIEATEAKPLLSLPLRLEVAAAEITIDLTLEHLEIGSGLRIALVDDADRVRAQFTLTGSGGGQAIERTLACGVDTREHIDRAQRPVASPDEHLRVHFGTTPGHLGCRIERAGRDLATTFIGAVNTEATAAPGPAIAPGDYTLRVEGFGHTSWPTALIARARIEHIDLTGWLPRAVAATTLERAHRAAFEGDPLRARWLYDSVPDDDNAALGGLLAAMQLGGSDDVAARVRRLVPAFEHGRGGVWGLVRSAPETMAALLRATDRAAFVTTFASAWSIARRYIDAADTQRMLELPAIAELTGASRAELELVLSATRHDLRSGAFARAHARTRRALETARPHDPDLDPLETELRLLAAAAADRLGLGGDAREHLLEWLTLTGADASEVDALGHRDDTAGLVDYLR